ISWFTSALASLFSLIMGPIAGYNLTTLVITLMCAYFGYRLAWYQFKDQLIGWLGGALFAIFPLRNGLAGSWPDLSTLQWLPLIVLFAMISIRTRQARYAIFAGIAMALTIWSSYYIFSISAILMGIIYLSLAIEDQHWRDMVFWRQVVIFGVVALLL